MKKSRMVVPRPKSLFADIYDVHVFSEARAKAIISLSKQTPVLGFAKAAEVLNWQLTLCLGKIGPYTGSSPSEQSRFAKRLKASAEECLSLLAPQPDSAFLHPFADDVVSCLVDHGVPIKVGGVELSTEEQTKRLLALLEELPRILSVLQSYSDHAVQAWRRPKTLNRPSFYRDVKKSPNLVRFAWVECMGHAYKRCFGKAPPRTATPGVRFPFGRFCEAARAILVWSIERHSPPPRSALAVLGGQLKIFEPKTLASFIANNGAQLSTLWASQKDSLVV